jgi:hypothetical protein
MFIMVMDVQSMMSNQNSNRMRTLEGVLKLMFMSVRITGNRLRGYTEDHIQRLNVNNDDHRYDQMIADTDVLYKDFCDELNAEFSEAHLREGATMNVDHAIAQFREMVRGKRAYIESFFPRDSAVYSTFFPDGLRTYTHATKANIEMVMTHFIGTLADHQAELGITILNDFTAAYVDYTGLRKEQLLKKAEVSAIRTRVKEKRRLLALALQQNMFTIAHEFAGDKDRAGDFFDFSLLYYQGNHHDGEEKAAEYSVHVPAETTVDSKIPLTGSEKMMLYNAGEVILKAYTTDDQNNKIVPPEAVVILPDEEKVIEPGVLGAVSNRFLMIANSDAEDSGEMVIYFL